VPINTFEPVVKSEPVNWWVSSSESPNFVEAGIDNEPERTVELDTCRLLISAFPILAVACDKSDIIIIV
jgi:hypothetical protein